MSVSTLSTAEVARLLDVHVSTAKRWCDEGSLPAERTGGGHRRFQLARVLEVARERGQPSFLDAYAPYQSHTWQALSKAERQGDFSGIVELATGWLLHTTPDRIAQLFIDLARRDVAPLDRILDDGVRGFLAEVGALWSAGQLRTGDEHVASAQVLEALTRLRMGPAERIERARSESRPVALAGSAETNDHHVGPAAVGLILERRGWNVVQLGARVPTEDIPALQRAQGADLVCLSFSALAAPSEAASTVTRLAAEYTGASPYALAIGGHVPEGLVDEQLPFTGFSAHTRLGGFDLWLDNLEADPDRGP